MIKTLELQGLLTYHVINRLPFLIYENCLNEKIDRKQIVRHYPTSWGKGPNLPLPLLPPYLSKQGDAALALRSGGGCEARWGKGDSVHSDLNSIMSLNGQKKCRKVFDIFV
jgi:hypothetical protein